MREAVVTGLPTKLSPLLSTPAVVPSVVAGGGLTPVNRAALPPAPSSPAHSSPPTSPHHDPEWPGASLHEQHDRMRSEGPEPPREAHWVTRCPPPTSCEPWQRVSPAGRRPPEAQLTVKSPRVCVPAEPDHPWSRAWSCLLSDLIQRPVPLPIPTALMPPPFSS